MQTALVYRTRDDRFPSTLRMPYVRIVDGTEQAAVGLGAAFLRNRAAIARYLRARGAAESVEDLLQELWMKVAAITADADVTDPTSYLFRMAHNLMLDRYRTERRRADRDRDYHAVSDLAEAGHDPYPAPDRALIAKQQLAEVEGVLTSLGTRTSYIFRRHRVEETPQREIALELGITISAVEKHLQKAYRAVRAIAASGSGTIAKDGAARDRG